MKINEKYLESFVNWFHEKGYDGKFNAIHIEDTDLKSCLQAFLNLQNGSGGHKYVFPMNLCTFADGGRWSDKYTQCVFQVDYDQVGGLYVSSMSAYRQADKWAYIEKFKVTTINNIPTKSELLTMDFNAPTLKNGSRTTNGKALLERPQIKAEHLDQFIQDLAAKGYTGKFMAPGISERELVHTVLDYLKARPIGIGNQNAFPVWLQTITQGNLMTDQRTVCMMKVQYDLNRGFMPDQLRIIRFDTRKGASVNETLPILLKSIQELPSAEKANSIALKNQKTERKKKGKKW